MVVLRCLIKGYIIKVVLVCQEPPLLVNVHLRPFGDLLNMGIAIICQDESWYWGRLIDGIAFL